MPSLTRAALFIAFSFGGAAHAFSPSDVPGTSPPVVLVIRAASDRDGRGHEERLYDELGFALDAFMLQSETAERADFARLPLAEQIAEVLPVARRDGAMAVIWLSFPLANQMMLHLVALGSGRALIRTIETDRSVVSASALALIARELLGTAYLFEPPTAIPREVSAVVSGVKRQFGTDATDAGPSPLSPWAGWVELQTPHPVAGGEYSAPSLEVGFGLERELPFRLTAGLGLNAGYGAVPRQQADGARFAFAGATASAFRGFWLGALRAGPFVSVSLRYAGFWASGPLLGLLLPRFDIGAQVRTVGPVGLRLGVALAGSPVRAELVRGSDVLYRSPWLELRFTLAIGFGL